MNKIKILYGLEAADYGTLKHLTYLLKYLNKDVFEIDVMISPARSIRSKKEIEKLSSFGVNIIQFPMKRKISLLSDGRCLIKLIRILYRNNYEIVHAHSSKAGLLFRLASFLKAIPMVLYTPHSFYFQGCTGISRYVYLWSESLLARISDYLIVSDNEIKYALECTHGSTHKVKRINNAIDTSEYKREEKTTPIKLRLEIEDTAKVILTVGRLAKQKDILTFINTAVHVLKFQENTVFVVAGEGEMEKEIRAEINKLGLTDKIKLIGHQYNIGEIYSIADIFVSTSLWEGMPYAIIEAAWYKLPIIASDLGYKIFSSEHDNFYLVNMKDHLAIAKNILRVIDSVTDAPSRKNCVNQNLEEMFSIDTFIKKHEILYKKVREKTAEKKFELSPKKRKLSSV